MAAPTAEGPVPPEAVLVPPLEDGPVPPVDTGAVPPVDTGAVPPVDVGGAPPVPPPPPPVTLDDTMTGRAVLDVLAQKPNPTEPLPGMFAFHDIGVIVSWPLLLAKLALQELVTVAWAKSITTVQLVVGLAPGFVTVTLVQNPLPQSDCELSVATPTVEGPVPPEAELVPPLEDGPVPPVAVGAPPLPEPPEAPDWVTATMVGRLVALGEFAQKPKSVEPPGAMAAFHVVGVTIMGSTLVANCALQLLLIVDWFKLMATLQDVVAVVPELETWTLAQYPVPQSEV